MDAERARTLLAAARADTEAMLSEAKKAGVLDRQAERESGGSGDVADALESEGVDNAVESSLHKRLAAIARAEKRLAEGTFGVSVRSGLPIPDERLEVAPTAELTVEESSDPR